MKCDTRNVAGWVVIPILLLLSTASVHSRCSIFNVVSYIDTTKGMATCLNININNMKTSDFLSLSHGILPLDECVSNSQQNTCISQVTDFIEDDSNNAFLVNIGQKLLQNDALACSCITQFVPTLDGCVSVLDEYNLYCDAFVKSKPSNSQCSSSLLGACNSINMTNPSNTNFGDILTCLMDNMAELQSDCMQLMNSMLASSFIACSSDIATTCYDIRNGPVGILTCLVENLNTLQPSCRAEIESLAGDVVPCATESAKYCPDKGDPDDVLACLIEKEAAGKPISASCKGMLAAFQNCEESDDISDPWSFGSGTDDDAAEPKPKPKPKPGPGAGFGSDDGNSPPNSPGAGPGGDGGRRDDDWSTSKQKPKPGPGGDGPPGGGGGGPPNGGGSPNGPGGGSGGHGGHGGHGPPLNMRSLEQRRSQAFVGSDIDRIKAQLKAAWLPQQPTQNRYRRLQPGGGNPPGGPSVGGGGPPEAPSNDGTGGQGGGGGKTKPMPCWMPGGGGSGKKEGGSWDDDNMAAGGRGPPGPGNGPGGAGAGEAAGGGQHGGHSGRSGTPAGDGLQGAAEDSLQPKRRMGPARIVLLVLALIGGAIFAFVWTKNGHSTHGLTPARALAILRETWSGTPAQQAALRINGEYTQAAAGSDDEGDNLDTNSADSTFASSSTRREKETARGGNGGKETALGGDVRGRMAAVEAGHNAKEAAVGGGHNKDRDREFQMISISTVTIDTAATATGGRNNLLTNSSDEAERGRGLSQLDV